MAGRVRSGNLGSAYGLRVSRPGHDVTAEPLGSTGIALDTRIADIGTVIASGLIQCGGGAVAFPGTLPYVPIAQILHWSGTNLDDYVYVYGSSVGHMWLPAYAVVTQSTIEVKAHSFPWYSNLSVYNPTGQWYLYYVFASG